MRSVGEMRGGECGVKIAQVGSVMLDNAGL